MISAQDSWGSDFSGSGCDAENDKLNTIRIIYIFLTAYIAAGMKQRERERENSRQMSY